MMWSFPQKSSVTIKQGRILNSDWLLSENKLKESRHFSDNNGTEKDKIP